MAFDEAVLRGSAWLSFALWASSEWLESADPPFRERARASFAAGAAVLFAHTGLALHVRHAWSQGDAFLEIARQTAEATGVAFGGGLFVNYAFLVVWLAVAVFWWRAPIIYDRRPTVARWAIRAVFLFMFLNAGVVFVEGPLRLLGLSLALVVIVAWYRGRRHPGRRNWPSL